ncbi:uridine diphosphate-N-acetylglucosamine-binding protein YvcK [Patescibacteria group bacterium]
MNEPKKIVIIGGGTGTFMVLSGLKKYPVDLSAVVAMADSGSSTGKLRDQLGVLPPGDVRQCLVALSESDKIMRELFNYRFEDGDFRGHSFGNLLISGLEKITGDFEQAVYKAGEILRIKGKVIPVTTTQTNLCADYRDGTSAQSESEIDESEEIDKHIESIYLNPPAKITHNAALAILHADMIVIGPGDIYTSLGQCLIVKGVREAIQKSKATKVFNMNLMTKPGQTTHMNARDHVTAIENWIGPNVIQYVLMNNKPLDTEMVEVYSLSGVHPVENDLGNGRSFDIIEEDFLANGEAKANKADMITRSLIRHDSDKIAQQLNEIAER